MMRAHLFATTGGVVAHQPASPSDGISPPTLTPREREMIQDWMARRYLQLHQKQVGRRSADLPLPASVRYSGQMQRLANHMRKLNQ
jgi:hypothetical protein